MERLTKRLEDGEAVMDCGACGVSWHKKRKKDIPYCTALFCRNRLKERLAAYEDTGLEPDDLKKAFNETAILKLAAQALSTTPDHLRDLLQAEQDGRLVVLPCMVGDTVYVIGEKRIMRCGIDEAYLDDKNGLEYLVSFFCDSDCDGCPFNNWIQAYSGEWYCDGEYGQSIVVGSEIGKTVFLTREDAEAAIAQKGDSEQ